ncbi:MAG: tellurite methyltransferase [Acidimicrobiales bacterium]
MKDEPTLPKQTEQQRWNERYASADPARRPVSPFLVEAAHLLPRSGTALDIAGGDGIEAVWLAEQGLTTTLLDVSDVALRTAEELAAAAGVALSTAEVDLDTEPLLPGPWDVIYCAHFLNRAVLEAAAASVVHLLLVAIATEVNLERHERPPRSFLLGSGELEVLTARHKRLEILRCDEQWRPNGNHEAWLIATVRN